MAKQFVAVFCVLLVVSANAAFLKKRSFLNTYPAPAPAYASPPGILYQFIVFLNNLIN